MGDNCDIEKNAFDTMTHLIGLSRNLLCVTVIAESLTEEHGVALVFVVFKIDMAAFT